MSLRYEMWAAPVNPEWCAWLVNQRQDRPRIEAVYPIVDNETCGPIDGTPRDDQHFCVCFTPKDQRKVWLMLNGLEEPLYDNPDVVVLRAIGQMNHNEMRDRLEQAIRVLRAYPKGQDDGTWLRHRQWLLKHFIPEDKPT